MLAEKACVLQMYKARKKSFLLQESISACAFALNKKIVLLSELINEILLQT